MNQKSKLFLTGFPCNGLKLWLDEGKGIPDKDKFLIDNYIPSETSLEFEDFEPFYDKRKEKLSMELCKVLNLKYEKEESMTV